MRASFVYTPNMQQRDAGDDNDQTYKAFRDAVNMSAATLTSWLETDKSREVGQKDGGDESTGHASGRRIVTILKKDKNDLTSDDYTHMKKVVGYIKRHLAQRPSGDVSDTTWRYSLMNWGHDPTKKSSRTLQAVAFSKSPTQTW